MRLAPIRAGPYVVEMEIHRGRLLDHVQLVVADIEASKRFYRAVFEGLGVPIGGEGDDNIWADELYISTAQSPSANGERTGRAHLTFQADTREKVEEFYRAGLANGGKDNGAPGERSVYHPGYFAAFLLDPDGNNIEAVHHGPAKRSAESVKFTF